MSDGARPKRGTTPLRPRSRISTRPRMEAAKARIAVVETELANLREERGADADQLAKMLVRMAETERARTAAEVRADDLTTRVHGLEARWQEAHEELEAAREERRRAAELMEQATLRAALAEQSAADGAAALERAHAELAADRTRLTDLEARLARLRREHGEEMTALRTAHAEASASLDRAARLIEEERAATVLACDRARTAEAGLAMTREIVARAAGLVEEIERREEMAAALRARALDQARKVLLGEAPASPPDDPPEPMDLTD